MSSVETDELLLDDDRLFTTQVKPGEGDRFL